MKIREYIFLAAALLLGACSPKNAGQTDKEETEPLFMNIIPKATGGYSLVSISPFNGSRDTLEISHPLNRLIVMSTSHIGFLSAIGCDSVIVGVSGADYICDTSVIRRIEDGTVADVGFDASPDYEKILALKPDLLLTYSVSPVKSRFLSKIESLGVKTFIVNEHLEHHPLARAAYIRLFGALTGNMQAADSVLQVVTRNYLELKDSVRVSPDSRQKKTDSTSKTTYRRQILVNIPYKDQWFIPGQENYLSHLFQDAGGEILGAEAGSPISGQISVERAYSLSKEADLWMNVGWCLTDDQLLSVNPLFDDFLKNIETNASSKGFSSQPVVWNDNKRLNAKGGNDFWESGVVRPDKLLCDLIGIFSGDTTMTTEYYRPLTPHGSQGSPTK